jgi:hypothetical protein
VARVGVGRLEACQESEEREGKERTEHGARSHVSPPSATLADQLYR